MTNWEEWDPSDQEHADAFKDAWSLVRLFWETNEEGEIAGWETAKEIYRRYDARDLVFALNRVGAVFAGKVEQMLVEPPSPRSPEEARAEMRSRLINGHSLEWPED
jgi:hypothetical protein